MCCSTRTLADTRVLDFRTGMSVLARIAYVRLLRPEPNKWDADSLKRIGQLRQQLCIYSTFTKRVGVNITVDMLDSFQSRPVCRSSRTCTRSVPRSPTATCSSTYSLETTQFCWIPVFPQPRAT